MTLDGRTGIIKEAGSFSVILRDNSGKTVVISTKNIVDKEIVIESGPEPETQEKRLERQPAENQYGQSYKESSEAA